MIKERLFRTQENSQSTAGTDPRHRLAILKFRRAAGKLYEDLIRATHVGRAPRQSIRID